MARWQIEDIAHSGQKGVRGSSRTDGRYPQRINRVVELDLQDINIGFPLILNYVLDENGNDYSRYYLQTSNVIGVYIRDDYCEIETNNSIFGLRYLGE